MKKNQITDSSIILLDEKALENNIDFLRKKMGTTVQLSAVVKANAYGHGIEEIVPIFEKHGVSHFSVFSYNEAIRVYNSLSKRHPIMIMGWISDDCIKDVIKKGIEFFVFNVERLIAALAFARKLKLKAKIHLEVETGMNRSGLSSDELESVVSILLKNEAYFTLSGFCTHLAGAESISNHARILKQLKKYNKMLAVLTKNNIVPKSRHVGNSAAAFIYPNSRMDMVRIGIMFYGFWSSIEVYIQHLSKKRNKVDPLKRILSWKSKIMAVKRIKSGEFVSYGMSYLAQTDIKTALIPIGYSSGYSRSLSNKGWVLIHGQLCSVIGYVNMNMIIADISNVADVAIGDEVVIIGKQDNLEIKVSAFSDRSSQLNYEVLTRLPQNIKRIVENK